MSIADLSPAPDVTPPLEVAPARARRSFKIQLFNSLLRLVPMAAKFLLTLYMGRFFSLDDIGVYGLVMGTVFILTTVLGQRLDFIITRDIVDVPPEKALRVMRDGFYFYCANYVALAAIIGLMIALHMPALEPRIMVYILVLSVLESLGGVASANMVALNQQITSNMVMLLRSGIWVVPVIALSMLNPAYRTYDTVLISWSIGAAFALIVALWCWRNMPWRAVSNMPFDWQWLKAGVLKSNLFWLGMIGLIGGSFSDRFVVNHFLGIEYVGILTFYASFTNAMLTLMQSGVLVFAYPRMIAQHRDGDTQGFHKEVLQTVWQMGLGVTVMSLVLGALVPFVSQLMHREAFVREMPTFWLLLIGTWLRINAELFFYVLFARHQDKPLCYGNMLFIIPTLLGGIIFVPLLGFSGIGYSCILAGAFLIAWRLWYSRDLMRFSFKPKRVTG